MKNYDDRPLFPDDKIRAIMSPGLHLLAPIAERICPDKFQELKKYIGGEFLVQGIIIAEIARLQSSCKKQQAELQRLRKMLQLELVTRDLEISE